MKGDPVESPPLTGPSEVELAFSRAATDLSTEFIAALREAAVLQGLEPEQASRIALQVVRGSVAVAQSSEKTLDQLIQVVASKGGTTEAGLAVLNKNCALENLVSKLIAENLS